MAIFISFFLFFILMMVVGLLASFKSEANTEDYLLAGRNVGAFPMALSAVASKVSGFMFIGMLGYVYVQGFSSVWFLIAWIFSDWVTWKMFYKPIREISEKENVSTITSFCITDTETKSGKYFLRFLSLVIVIFMGVYAAAQLSAGAKALESVLSINYSLSVIAAGVLIALYCFAGGIRASIWTDSVQSIIMLVAMLCLAFVAVSGLGGFNNMEAALADQGTDLVQWIPEDLKFGFVIFLLGRIANGFALLGQPHIVVRSMLIKDLESFKLAEKVYFIYYIAFCAAMFLVALSARVILPDLINSDPEMALLELSKSQLPNYLIGLILAGVFSSTISTADSQILSCTASITQDLFTKFKNNYWFNKIVTLLILIFVTVLALISNESVFSLTMFGWVSLGVVFAPLICLKVFNYSLANISSIFISFVSLTVALFWSKSSFHGSLNEVFVGFACFFMLILLRKLIIR
ncbi:MAG: sodium/proline symporter [Candidatus Caenarcaniphilales bacterium]|nr:sodium/proline symporter [Candidatus Caenarcaniphilales bacterium]